MQIVLDCLGDMCPLPMIKMKEQLEKMSEKDSLLVITDHSCVARSLVEELCKSKYRFEENEVMNGIWEITVRKLKVKP